MTVSRLGTTTHLHKACIPIVMFRSPLRKLKQDSRRFHRFRNNHRQSWRSLHFTDTFSCLCIYFSYDNASN